MEGRVFSSGTYRFGFNGQEKDDEIYGEGNTYSAEFWEYDARVGRRWNVDPKAFDAPSWSPYRTLFNNPIFWIDKLGLFEDEYGVDKNGNITLLKKTDDKTDKIFVLDDKNKKVDLDNNGNSNNDYVEVKDKSLLPALSKKHNGIRVVNGSQKSDDLMKLFLFFADNTDVEWRFDRYLNGKKNNYALGTVHSTEQGPTTTQMGFEQSKMVASVHNHPKDVADDWIIGSMGYSIEDGKKISSGDWYYHRQRVNNEVETKPYPNYVYFPGKGRGYLYSIEYKSPTYIRNIRGDYKKFYFGVLNHQ
jgi:RHS repeat-associated protein